jgi:LysR family glycine cleavage system transcriptional activator
LTDGNHFRQTGARHKVNILYSDKEFLYINQMAAATHLRALQALELAIRMGSLKDAAAEMTITPAAVGQRIKALEDYLGFDLIVRGRSGIRATHELEQALAHLGAGFRELDTVCRILDFQRVNEVHITADSDWADLWLKPRLPDFRKSNPNTMFCINGVGDVPVRLGEADCEIRFGDAGDDDELLFHDYLLPVSSPVNTERLDQAPAENRLEGFPLLHLDCYTFDGGAIGWREWIAKYGYRSTAPERGIRYRKLVQALEAVYANAGLLVCGMALVEPQIEEGRLSIPFPLEKGEWSANAYCVSFRPEALRRAATQTFRDWLLDQAGATRARLDSAVTAQSFVGFGASP